MSDVLTDAVADLRPMGLETVLDEAALQTRTDRKYVVPERALAGLVAALADHLVVLEVAGRRAARYESVYFDTPDLTCFRAAAHGRRRRIKVRTRSYLDDAVTVLEVKRPGARGETVKERLPYALSDRARLTAVGRRFVDGQVLSPGWAAGLIPVLRTSYRRATLLDRAAGARVTCDADLVCDTPEGRSTDLPGWVLVETKSPAGPTLADRLLWSAGLRPVTISKFCAGLAVLDPSLPANRWHRELRRWGPARSPQASATPDASSVWSDVTRSSRARETRERTVPMGTSQTSAVSA